MFAHGRHRALWLVLALYVIAGVLSAAQSPVLDVSDEPRHFAYVQHLANGGPLPVQRVGASETDAPWHQEGSQPPLYYALAGLIARPFDRTDFADVWRFNPHARLGRADTTHNWNQIVPPNPNAAPRGATASAVLVIRLLGVVFGGIAVLCTYAFARELRPGSAELAPLAAGLTAFNPMFVHIMASVNNDTLTTALASWALVLGARMIRRGVTVGRALVLGCALGAAALSKTSGLALVIVVPLAVLLHALRARTPLRALLAPACALAVAVAAIAGWFYVRNWALYGEPTGTQMMAAIAGPREAPPTLFELIGEWRGFLMAYIGLFGAVNIPMHGLIYDLFYALLIAAGMGLLLRVRDTLRGAPGSVSHDRAEVSIALMAFAALAVAFAALVRWTLMTLASQGRLLFPLIAAISTLCAAGLLRLLSAAPRAVVIAVPRMLLAALCALTLLAPVIYVRPAYALPARGMDEAVLPLDRRTELVFGDVLRWIGYRVDTPAQRVRPGELLDVTLYWQALKPVDQDYSLFIKLFAPDQAELVNIDTYPGGGTYPTRYWRVGEIVADRYRMRLPESVTVTLPALLEIDAGVYLYSRDAAASRTLDTRDRAGAPTGRQRYPVAVLSPVQSRVIAPSAPRFSAANVSRAAVSIEGPDRVTLELSLDFTGVVEREYTLFVHVLDAAGKLLGQGDAPGRLPPRWWRRGDGVRDRWPVVLSAPLTPGETYTVRYGLYTESATGVFERMPAFDASGAPAQDNALSVVFVAR